MRMIASAHASAVTSVVPIVPARWSVLPSACGGFGLGLRPELEPGVLEEGVQAACEVGLGPCWSMGHGPGPFRGG